MDTGPTRGPGFVVQVWEIWGVGFWGLCGWEGLIEDLFLGLIRFRARGWMSEGLGAESF